MEMRTSGAVALQVDNTPEKLYELVSDVTRTGEWSPECHRCEWIDRPPARAGTRFRGWNRAGVFRWSRICEVTSARPGSEFIFRTVPGRIARDSTSWQYRFEPAGTGTRLSLRYDFLEPPRFPVPLMVRLFMKHHADMRPHMTETLDNIKELAEHDAQPHGTASASTEPRGLLG